MLVEDDYTMVSLLQTLLKMEGFEVLALQVDADVLSAVKTEKPNILLLDVHLAQHSGLEILDQIRNDHEVQNTRVIMSSGASVKDECIKHGANGFLMKPYMPDDLIKLLKQNLTA